MTSTAEILSFNFQPPTDPQLAAIYGKFLELIDQKKMPKKTWYQELEALIEAAGHARYQEHLKETFETLLTYQNTYKRIERKLKAEKKSTVGERSFREHLGEYVRMHYHGLHGFYFCGMEEGWYLKGLILSVRLMPDPVLLKLVEQLVLAIPFLHAGHSNAPTGMFTYDALEVFTNLPYPQSVPYIMNLQARIKQSNPQKRFQKALAAIAKKNGVEEEEIIELGIPDYGFVDYGMYEKEIGEYVYQLTYPTWKKKKVSWINVETGKQQKSIPKEIKESHAETLKFVRSHTKEIDTLLSTHAKRIDRLYLAGALWSMEDWNARYGEHVFMSLVAHHLVWLFSNEEDVVSGFRWGEDWVNAKGEPLDLAQFKTVRLWHPLSEPQKVWEEWKTFFAGKKIVQPFKQVEREVYDVSFPHSLEGKTMEGPLLFQLCKSRGWIGAEVPKLRIPKRKMEVHLYLNGYFGRPQTFWRLECLLEGNLVGLADLPEVVRSEICRDLDLFFAQAT